MTAEEAIADEREATARALRVVQLFAEPSATFRVVVQTHLQRIVEAILGVLDPESSGTMLNFKKIFRELLALEPFDTLNALVPQHSWRLLHHLDNAAVQETMLHVLSGDYARDSDGRVALYRHIHASRFLNNLVDCITQSPSDSATTTAAATTTSNSSGATTTTTATSATASQ